MGVVVAVEVVMMVCKLGPPPQSSLSSSSLSLTLCIRRISRVLVPGACLAREAGVVRYRISDRCEYYEPSPNCCGKPAREPW